MSGRRTVPLTPAYVVLPPAMTVVFAAAVGCGPGRAAVAEALVAAVVAAGARAGSALTAVTLAVLAWSVLTGFAVNADGRLTASGADGERLALLVGVALAARVGGALRRRWRVRPDRAAADRYSGTWSVYPRSGADAARPEPSRPEASRPKVSRPPDFLPTRPFFHDRGSPHA